MRKEVRRFLRKLKILAPVRINRVQFLVRTIAWLLAFIIGCGALVGGIIGAFEGFGISHLTPFAVSLVAAPSYLVCYIASLSTTVSRLRDMNLCQWYFLFLLIPGLGWCMYVALFLMPGTEGENDYPEEV